MGEIEKRTKKRVRIQNLQNIILGVVDVVGAISMSRMTPAAVRILRGTGHEPKKFHKQTIQRSRDRLISNNYLVYENGFLRITEKGKRKLLLERGISERKPKSWDKKWRVLIFDIKEKRKKTREKIRRTLHSIGFIRLQDSVWVYPYPCEDYVVLLKSDFKIGKDLLYMVVDEIENDHHLREVFSLV